MNRILLVEDHERLARLTCSGLEAAGIASDVVHRGYAAWAAIQEVPYGALVLDRGLPDGERLISFEKIRLCSTTTRSTAKELRWRSAREVPTTSI